ncbi:hypothetical protein [Burkholderia gladioli]|uniref:hypothetical protein n=1 Tax=Burkholderia gladioli TaxID=28095 RepID=UPI0016410D71|nr:hypothetical protein [Burkholderia gladioli]
MVFRLVLSYQCVVLLLRHVPRPEIRMAGQTVGAVGSVPTEEAAAAMRERVSGAVAAGGARIALHHPGIDAPVASATSAFRERGAFQHARIVTERLSAIAVAAAAVEAHGLVAQWLQGSEPSAASLAPHDRQVRAVASRTISVIAPAGKSAGISRAPAF